MRPPVVYVPYLLMKNGLWRAAGTKQEQCAAEEAITIFVQRFQKVEFTFELTCDRQTQRLQQAYTYICIIPGASVCSDPGHCD